MIHHQKRRAAPAFWALLVIVLVWSCGSAPKPRKEVTLNDLVMSGDVDAIKKFYSNQEQLNQKDGQGLYPLHYAVMRGDPQIAEILMVLGANPDVVDPAGKTPLRYAIDRSQIPMVKMLIGRAADPFVTDVSGVSPAEAALNSSTEMLLAVFNAKNINNSGQDGRTILHIAADRLMVDEVNLLLDQGASVQAKDKAERSALDLALLSPDDKRAAIIAEKLILKGANPSFPEFEWFATTVRSADFNTVRFSNGNTPLHEAVSRFQFGFVDFLLSKGLNANVKNVGGDAPLHLAVRSGWLSGAEILLKNGADPDIRDAKENTPLHLPSPATLRLKMTQLLLRFKADPGLKDKEGNTPLHKAVKLAYEPSIVEELIKAGAPVNSANVGGDTPLMLCVKAGTYEYASALIAAGADVFLRNLNGDSPLSVAVGQGTMAVDKIVLPSNVSQRDNTGNSIISTAVTLRGSPEVISLILSKGADPNVRNNSGDNALHIAVRNNLEPQGLLLLQAKADIFAQNVAQETPVFLALTAANGPYDWFFTPAVTAARDSNGDTVAHLAARKNLPDGLEYLRQKGADMEAVNAAKETLLHVAVRTDAADAVRYLISGGAFLSPRDINGDAPLNVAVLSNAKTCLQVLVLSGVDLNTRNFTGEAPLHQAARTKNLDFVSYLVERGAALEVLDNRGLTPLALAAKEAQTAIVQYLLKAGAFVDARDYAGSTPLLHAVDVAQLDLVRALTQATADILAKNAAGDSPLLASMKKGPAVLRELLSGPALDKADSEGKTPLRQLVDSKASAAMISLALAAGADPNSRDRYANTPLHAALTNKDYETAQVLLNAKADPFARNYQGITPVAMVMAEPANLKDFVNAADPGSTDALGDGFLHYAVRTGNAAAVKTLLELGLDKNLKNIAGESPVDVAKTKNDAAILSLLQ
ncbi:MAG: ankyrin repeat domain-containing protein [Spirochaetaceae bacterium]|nr:ankyrin repeat domain-containing protein [Spirochaetaceae bacterium]